MLNPESVTTCTCCMTVKKQDWTCECGTVNPNQNSSCSFCSKLNMDRLKQNFERLQRKQTILEATIKQKDHAMAEKQKAHSQTITQLQDLKHAYQRSQSNEKRLRMDLQDAEFDLEDAKRLISQLQNRINVTMKRQASVLKETAAVATELHEKQQVETDINTIRIITITKLPSMLILPMLNGTVGGANAREGRPCTEARIY